jgi:hypothetical protein
MHTEDYIPIPKNIDQGSPKGMKVPEGYFQDFESKMLARVHSELIENKEVISIRSVTNLNSWMMKAAIAASLVVGLFVLTTQPTIEMANTELAMEASEDLDFYEFDEYMLADNFSMEDLEDISFSEEFVSSDEIMDYILNENYSEYTIIENL